MTLPQLRYYESKDDTNGKGEVDLSEVESVNLGVPVLGAPRNVDEKALFEVRLWVMSRCSLLNQIVS